MKRKLAIMMAICLVAGAFNGTMGMPIVEAAEVQQETENNSGYTYNYWSSNSVEITGYKGQETELVIPSEIDGKTVTSIGYSAFEDCSGLTSIKIPSSVTSIGYSAFRRCSGLTKIEIPSSVTSIGYSAFEDCSGLTRIEIPSSVTSIDDSAFNGCSGLTKIEIPSSVTSIDDSAFRGCSGLTSIKVEEGNLRYDSRENCNAIIEKESNSLVAGCKNTIIPSGVTRIGDFAFDGCSGLTRIEIPSSVTRIGDAAFEGCSGLTSMEIPSGVTRIGDFAFNGCRGLTSIGIPSSVTLIGDATFNGCSGLTSIKIPSGVTRIGASAFNGCRGLTGIAIPSSVTSIGDSAFSGCSALTIYCSKDSYAEQYAKENNIATRDISDTSEENPTEGAGNGNTGSGSTGSGSIGNENSGNGNADSNNDYTYSYMSGTDSVRITGYTGQETELTIPSKINGRTVTEIGSYAFSGCSGLTSIEIPSGVTLISDFAFKDCSGLARIEIPSGVTLIGESAFSGCSGLTSIAIPSGVMSICAYAFESCSGLTSIKVEEGNRWYDSRENCNAIIGKESNRLIVGCKNTIIPPSVTSIGDSAFSGCSRLTSMEIPSNVTSIGNAAFSGCSGITSIEIPPSVTSIGSYAFRGCSGLTSIKVEEGNRWYDSRENCNAIIEKESNSLVAGCKNTIIPPSVTSIEYYAFYGCNGLTRIEIPSGVTRIGESAFSGCSGLTRIEIPSSVTSIGFLAFSGCSGLTIYCSKDSYAERYAKLNNFIVRDISEATENNPTEGTGNGNTESGSSGSGNTGSGNSGNGNTDNNSDYTYSSLLGDWGSVEITGYTGQETELVIPSGINGKTVASIGNSAFENCSNIVSIKLPDTLREIGHSAFSGCSNLKSVKLPDGITEIGGYAFEGCNSLIDIELPTGITEIGGGVFYGCSNLKRIKLPDGITEIGSFMFNNCSSLTNIELPTGIIEIGSYAFEGCNSLTDIEIPSNVRNVGRGAFSHCSSLTDMEIPDRVAEITESVFFDCTNLKAVKLPEGVASIGELAFYNCKNLKSIIIPNSVKNIDFGAFDSANPALTIICSKGSYAEQYAKENNFAIQYISGTPDQNPTEKPGSGNTEEPGKEPSENPGNQPSGTPDQNPTEKPGSGSTEKPAVSPDGKTIQTITAEDIVKTMGDEPFYLDAETDGDGTLTYESKNPDIVKVDGTGKATIVSAGTAKISVTASATDTYSSAIKTITVTVIPEGYTPIYDIADLYAIRNNPRGDYILVNDIDMSATQKGGDYDCGTGWDSIEEFSGTLDGNGHRIVGMNIFGEFTTLTTEEIGLFESCGGSIKNLFMKDCDINIIAVGERFSPYLGTIAGFGGSIENCCSSGKIAIQGNSTYYSGYVGGLVGMGGEFKNCFSTCEIDCENAYTEGFSNIGGIVGYTSLIVQCYNVGSVKGNENTGIGSVCGSFEYGSFGDGYENLCYLKGTAARGIGKYNSSDASDSPDCVALTEAQMKNPKLFTGFDFTDTWEVDPYCSYPYPQLKNNRMVRINSIRLDTAPTKLTYNQGESLKLNGAALEISYEDGINTTIPLEKDMLSGYDMNKIGQQTVTVSYGGGETSFDIEVKEVQVSGISIPKTLSLDRSKQKQLTVSITPANASDKSVTWESDNPSVASVSSSGLVKAKAKGKAVITATASNGVKASCTVTVLVPAVSVKLSQSSLSMTAGSQCSIKAQVLPLESTDSVSWKSSNKAVAEVYDGSILAIKEGTAKITAYTKSGAKASCTVTVKKPGNGASSEIKRITSQKAKIKSAKNVKKKSVTLKLSGSVNGSGYKIQYGTSRKFKGAKTVTAKGSSVTIKKLKAKKAYYIRARIYKKISGRTYYGKWSSVKSVKIKK